MPSETDKFVSATHGCERRRTSSLKTASVTFEHELKSSVAT
jgi:hypothetical protein